MATEHEVSIQLENRIVITLGVGEALGVVEIMTGSEYKGGASRVLIMFSSGLVQVVKIHQAMCICEMLTFLFVKLTLTKSKEKVARKDR